MGSALVVVEGSGVLVVLFWAKTRTCIHSNSFATAATCNGWFPSLSAIDGSPPLFIISSITSACPFFTASSKAVSPLLLIMLGFVLALRRKVAHSKT